MLRAAQPCTTTELDYRHGSNHHRQPKTHARHSERKEIQWQTVAIAILIWRWLQLRAFAQQHSTRFQQQQPLAPLNPCNHRPAESGTHRNTHTRTHTHKHKHKHTLCSQYSRAVRCCLLAYDVSHGTSFVSAAFNRHAFLSRPNKHVRDCYIQHNCTRNTKTTWNVNSDQ